MIRLKFDKEYNNISEELFGVFEFIETTLMKELPVQMVTPDYFIFAVLNQKNSLLYKRLENNLTSMALSAIHDSYYAYIQSIALSAVKPSRTIACSKLLNDYMHASEQMSENVKNGKITSELIFAAILGDMSEENKIRKVFNKAGISMKNMGMKILDEYNSGVREKEQDKPKEPQKQQQANIRIIPAQLLEQNPKLLEEMGLKPSQTGKGQSFIKQYCTNLNDLVDAGKIDELVGREREVNSIIRTLGRRKKNNVILLGGEGVGKTAIAESIAYKIVNKEVPQFLADKELVSMDMTALLAGTTLRGMFEERVKGILDEVKNTGKYILFIDNIGAVLADNNKNDYDISAMLSESLENGTCQVIGTSDFKSFRKTFDKNPSLSRRFQKVLVEAPTEQDSIDILNGLKESYEKFHNVKYTDEAVLACVKLAAKYITERNLPDSAIDILDEAGSNYGTVIEPKEIKTLTEEVKFHETMIDVKKSMEEYKAADEEELNMREAKKRLERAVKKYKKDKEDNPIVIDKDMIVSLVAEKTGISMTQLSMDDKAKLSEIDNRLKEYIIGQDEAIETVCRALKRNRVGLSNHGTLFSGICIGATGVGKTFLAKRLAYELFGSETALVRFDMSEYPDKSAVNKLIGSNPGYIGYEEGGQLTEAIKNKKYCVLLLDEIEKADPEIYNIFLQVLDEGFLTDNSGQKVDFRNVIVLFTSNTGAADASKFKHSIGFTDDTDANQKRILTKSLKDKFPPEFLNRLDNVIYFNPLTEDNLKEIIKLELDKTRKRIEDIGYKFEYTNDTVNTIFDIVSEEKEYGARPIMRAIQTNVEDKITDMLLEKDYEKDYVFKI